VRPTLALALALALALVTAGCLSLRVAYVPDSLLTNGWAKDGADSQSSPTSQSGGFVKTQSLVYQDTAPSKGYKGSLTVTTLRALTRPSEDKLRSMIEDRVREQTEAKGVTTQAGGEQGTRSVSSGATAYWFVFNGTVSSGTFFSSSAQVKVFGEVFQCPTGGADVFTVGLAQTTDVQSIGGVPIASNPDYTTWSQIVQDPDGRVEGYAGSDGLAFGVHC
jgi:hypothetical protein